MRRLFLILMWAALPLAGFEPLPACGPVIAPGGSDAAWQPLFTALAAQGSIWSAFTEQRWFLFRKTPIILKGELRFSPVRGLSLQYREPETRTIIADDHGLAMRDARGRTHEVPSDPRAMGLTTALLPIMRFDLRVTARPGVWILCPAIPPWPARSARSLSRARTRACASWNSATRRRSGWRSRLGRCGPA